MVRLLLLSGALLFLLGAYLSHALPLAVLYGALALLLFGALTSILRNYRTVALVGVLSIALLSGMLRGTMVQYEHTALAPWYNKTLQVSGVVTGDIEQRMQGSRYMLTLLSAEQEPFNESIVLVREKGKTICTSGERAEFTLIVREVEPFLTETGRIFPYPRYLAQRGIEALADNEENGCTGRAERVAFIAFLREQFVIALQSLFPDQEASLLSGLLLGMRGSLSPELLEAFRLTGLIHIIVLSGYNITIVAEAVRAVTTRLLKRGALPITLLVIIGFVLLAGAQTAAIRAGGMAVIALLARATGREYDGIVTLALVAALMTLHAPEQVLFNTSFHMSFLATLGLLLYATPIERHLSAVPSFLQLRSITAATIAVHITLLPYLAYAIGEVSIVSLLANILVLPLIPIAMATGALTVLLWWGSESLAHFFAPLALLPLETIILTTNALATSYATIALPPLSVLLPILTTLFFIATGIAVVAKATRSKKVTREEK